MARSAHAADKFTCSMNRTCVIAAFDCARAISAHAADSIFSAYRTCIFAISDSAVVIAAHAACITIVIFANYSAAVRTVLEYAFIILSAYTSPLSYRTENMNPKLLRLKSCLRIYGQTSQH